MSVAAGPWYLDDVLTFYQTAHDPATGGAVDADAVPDYRVYEAETGTAILTGSMALLDSGNTIGLYSESITLSAANGFEVGKAYVIYREVEVDGVIDTAEESFKVSGNHPADLKAVNAVTDSADRLEKHISVVGTFTVDSGASTTSVPLSAVSPAIGVADQFKGRLIVFDTATTTANLCGAVARISAHTAGAGVGTLTVTPALPAAPASGDIGVIV